MSVVKIALAQINCTVGDFSGNVSRVLEAARVAHAQGADILLTPELSLCGYPPEDLLMRPAFLARSTATLNQLARELEAVPGLYVVVGHPHAVDVSGNTASTQRVWNAASVLTAGRVRGTYCKRELPNNTVFDEMRYFTPGNEALVFSVKGVRFGINICEDAWHPYAAQQAKSAGAQVILVPNASPYHVEKEGLRENIIRARVRETGLPHVYVNMVGGQDELVFDGASFVIDAQGKTVARLPQFEAALQLVTFEHGSPQATELAVPQQREAQVYAALKLGVADYIEKNGFPGALIGLSGGVDSALVLAVAVDALGADRVRAVMMPSRHTAEISWVDAREMATRLGVRYDEIPISPVMESFRASLAQEFSGLPEDTTEENIQARIRGTLLMALSNKHGSLVLTTGNKSEMAVGYCTLYGDMAGGFAVLKDIAKTLVYRLCRWRNTVSDVIPERILTRAPSAELRDNQTDQDSLPDYAVLDAILALYMEQDRSITDIVAAGYALTDVERVTRLIKLNEYKRRQAPVGIRVTHRAFGRDWRYPITSLFHE